MSSYFDDASLVMIPSGYKTSKVYSVKPTDGSGDLTFSRSNDTASRVNSAGLIEKVRTNQVLQSQTFDNASWVKYNSSVTANSTTAPDGTSTADTLVDNTANDIHVTYQSIALSAGEHTISCYAKANTLSHLSIYIFDGTNFFSSGIFNLSNGTVSGAGSIVSAGNGWYRVSFTATIGSGSGNVYIALSNGSTISYVGSGQSIYIWGYQVEAGVATAYIATTSAAVSVGPVANVPRLDYLNSSCPRLLLEPQRTNLVTYSEQFDNAAWTKSNATVTANTSVSPDGYTNADTVVITSGGYLYRDITSYSAVSGQSVTISVFAKNQINNFLIFGGATAAGTDVYKIENYGNGWYRHSVVRTFTTTATTLLQYLIATNMVGTHIIWGAQIEGSNSAYATSYIPTLGAAVTRGADTASKTSASALIGQTEGTLYAEFTRLNVGNAVVLFQTNDGTSNNRVQIEISTSGAAIGVALSGGALTCLIIGPTLALGQTHKVAISYKANDFKLYVNGVLAGTDTSGAVPVSMNRIDLASEIGTSYGGVSVSQILNFPTALSSAQLAELTA